MITKEKLIKLAKGQAQKALFLPVSYQEISDKIEPHWNEELLGYYKGEKVLKDKIDGKERTKTYKYYSQGNTLEVTGNNIYCWCEMNINSVAK